MRLSEDKVSKVFDKTQVKENQDKFWEDYGRLINSGVIVARMALRFDPTAIKELLMGAMMLGYYLKEAEGNED